MAFDSVPWVIGGGAEHTDELLRVAANAWSRDSQGVVLPGDMKVSQLSTPGSGVQIADGACVIRNRQAGGQSYVGRVGSLTQVNPAATGGSGRSDLIIARIIDPDFSPWVPYTDEEEIAHGPYFEPYIVSGVSPSTTKAEQVVSYSAYELARIDIPSSTSTFTDAMIHDLRSLAQPRVGFAYDIQTVSGTQYLTSTSWVDWPTNSLQVTVPRWATHCQVIIRLNGPLGWGDGTDSADAYVRVNMGGSTGPSAVWDWNGPSNLTDGDAVMIPISAYGEFNVTAVQDEVVTIKPQAERYAMQHSSSVSMMSWHQVEFDVRFSERVV